MHVQPVATAAPLQWSVKIFTWSYIEERRYCHRWYRCGVYRLSRRWCRHLWNASISTEQVVEQSLLAILLNSFKRKLQKIGMDGLIPRLTNFSWHFLDTPSYFHGAVQTGKQLVS